MRRPLLVSVVALALWLAPRPGVARPEPKIGLVVVVVVDQLASHYLTRWGGLLEDGFGALRRRGAYFPRAQYAYANTETGPGHATLSTGAWPSIHGIVGNIWYDGSGRQTGCVADQEYGASPHNLEVPGIGDAIRIASNGRSKVVTLGLKDRATILLGGKGPTLAAWYDPAAGKFAIGRWPGQPAPPAWWNQASLERGVAAQAHGRVWERLLAEPIYTLNAGADDLASEAQVPGLGRTFPRTLGVGLEPLSEDWRESYTVTPSALESLFALAERAVREERLGTRGETDMLALAVSGLDYAGHWWGSHSQEALDLLLRIDRALGALVRSLDQQLGKKVLFVVSADHGVLQTPEEAERLGLPYARIDNKPIKAAAEAGAREGKLPGTETVRVLELNAPRIFLSPTEPKVDRLALRRRAAKAVAATPRILEAVAVDDVAQMDEPWRSYYRRSIYPGRAGDVLIRHRPLELVDTVDASGHGVGTGHGSPYGYDMTVPLIIAGPGVRAGVDPRPVDMTRLAPTIAALIGVDPPAAAYESPLEVF